MEYSGNISVISINSSVFIFFERWLAIMIRIIYSPELSESKNEDVEWLTFLLLLPLHIFLLLWWQCDLPSHLLRLLLGLRDLSRLVTCRLWATVFGCMTTLSGPEKRTITYVSSIWKIMINNNILLCSLFRADNRPIHHRVVLFSSDIFSQTLACNTPSG